MTVDRISNRDDVIRLALADVLMIQKAPSVVQGGFGVSPAVATLLARTNRIALRVTAAVMRRSGLEHVTRLHPAVRDAIIGQGPDLESLRMRLGLTVALTGTPILDRTARDDLASLYGEEILQFALRQSFEDAGCADVEPSRPDDVRAVGTCLFRTWCRQDPLRIGSWPIDLGPEPEADAHLVVIRPEPLRRLMTAALADVAAAGSSSAKAASATAEAE